MSPSLPAFAQHRSSAVPTLRRWLSLLLILLLLVTGVKAWRIYQTGMNLYRSATVLRASLQPPAILARPEDTAASLMTFQHQLQSFSREARPLLWLAPNLGWIPVYGGDLKNAPHLLELANHLTDASLLTLQAGAPILNAIHASSPPLTPPLLTTYLQEARPRLEDARAALDLAHQARSQIEIQTISPRLKQIIDALDPRLAELEDGLNAAIILPRILGAAENAPKTYLLLVQNADELRPSGGFITTFGSLTLQNGSILNLDFEGVDNSEDWSKPYPAAPWQLQEYMNASILILRDSNWFADFPTSARWAEYLYAYNHPEPLDGVIAFDQHFLVILLNALGPLQVEGAPYPLTAANVIEYMRSAKAPPPNEPMPADWYRKQFIENIAAAMLQELMSGKTKDWRALSAALLQGLNERHLLLYFHDPVAASLLAEHGWDNRLRPLNGDFLMTTDSNIGFNKTNALMQISLSYEVDLTDLSAPKSVLRLTHHNNADTNIACIHWDYKPEEGVAWYPMNRCYWSYLRVYKQSGVELTHASPHEIPAEMILTRQKVPPRVDLLDESIEGVQGYGTLLVVPGGQSLQTAFEFSLPPAVVSHEADGRFTYRLKVQKQPGTLANPLTIRLQLPPDAILDTTSLAANLQGETLFIQTSLRTDVYLEVVFHLP
jgi:hypothetical protein